MQAEQRATGHEEGVRGAPLCPGGATDVTEVCKTVYCGELRAADSRFATYAFARRSWCRAVTLDATCVLLFNILIS